MPLVRFTSHLTRYFPGIEPLEVDATTAKEAIDAVEAKHPGFLHYVCDERGVLRKHVNVFVDGEMVHDRRALSDALKPESEVFVMQALSGGSPTRRR